MHDSSIIGLGVFFLSFSFIILYGSAYYILPSERIISKAARNPKPPPPEPNIEEIQVKILDHHYNYRSTTVPEDETFIDYLQQSRPSHFLNPVKTDHDQGKFEETSLHLSKNPASVDDDDIFDEFLDATDAQLSPLPPSLAWQPSPDSQKNQVAEEHDEEAEEQDEERKIEGQPSIHHHRIQAAAATLVMTHHFNNRENYNEMNNHSDAYDRDFPATEHQQSIAPVVYQQHHEEHEQYYNNYRNQNDIFNENNSMM
eukprot:GDKJ01062454.1.p1 GENE.GDKJ01062454.1~~GDKJ01062454.1.p1  ORF type:complete len:256 (-),score=59.33 GDKJ01062454.1:232-999(-)